MDAVAPDYWWIGGSGLWTAPQFHDDFYEMSGWMSDDIRQVTCMKPLGDGKFQAHVYLTWEGWYWGFYISIYSNRGDWMVDDPLTELVTITGDTEEIGVQIKDNDDGTVELEIFSIWTHKQNWIYDATI